MGLKVTEIKARSDRYIGLRWLSLTQVANAPDFDEDIRCHVHGHTQAQNMEMEGSEEGGRLGVREKGRERGGGGRKEDEGRRREAERGGGKEEEGESETLG